MRGIGKAIGWLILLFIFGVVAADVIVTQGLGMLVGKIAVIALIMGATWLVTM